MASKTSTTRTTLPEGITGSMTLEIDGGVITVPLKRHEFSTGSVGFTGSGVKVEGADGRRYQISMNAVLVGSKPETA